MMIFPWHLGTTERGHLGSRRNRSARQAAKAQRPSDPGDVRFYTARVLAKLRLVRPHSALRTPAPHRAPHLLATAHLPQPSRRAQIPPMDARNARKAEQDSAVRLARYSFYAASAYGLLCLPPQYFMEQHIGVMQPPAITHPEFFYGFLGVACAWQLAFFTIARSPLRLRPLMPAAVVEKISFAGAVFWLYAKGRVDFAVVPFACVDLLLGALFTASYLRLAAFDDQEKKDKEQ